MLKRFSTGLLHFFFFTFIITGMINDRKSHAGDNPESAVYSIEWTEPDSIITREGENRLVPDFKNALHYPEFDYMPVYSITFDHEAVRSVQIEVVEKDTVTGPELELIDPQLVVSEPDIHINRLSEKGQLKSQVYIFPWVKDTLSGVLFKIESFRIRIEAESPARSERIMRTTDAASSVLATGNWYKIAVTEDGIYKLDYAFLEELGMDPGNIDPEHIQLYGNGGAMLSQANSAERPSDLIENAIYISGDEDNRFDENDHILFYGQSPHKIGLVEREGTFEISYSHHDYSDTAFYFLTVGDDPGKRLSVNQDLGPDFPRITQFDQLYKHEKDLVNLLSNLKRSGSGREWYGEVFQIKTSYEFEFASNGLIPDSEIRVLGQVMAHTVNPAEFNFNLNGYELGQAYMETVPVYTYSVKGRKTRIDFSVNTNNLSDTENNLRLTIDYRKGSPGESRGFLDYLNIWCKRELAGYPLQTHFRSTGSLNNTHGTFEIKDTGSPFSIWEITDPLSPSIQIISGGEGVYTFGTATDDLKEFILFNNNNLLSPHYGVKIDNQDLHSMSPPELLIISHPDFIPAARRLASHRQGQGMTAEVVNVFKIYNEFSSGSQDVTAIRDFVKYLYDQNDNLKYLLLFGRGSYDYKNRTDFNTNFVPIYQSRNSLHPVYSYSSDDFYGFLDETEGEWFESFVGNELMDIGIGRIPVKTLREANSVVDKIIVYETDPRCFGPWRNDIYFVADDGDGPEEGTIHSRDAERLTLLIDSAHHNFNIGKIYVDAFPQHILPNRQEAPEANQAIKDAVKQGVLIMNFTGHGNEIQWTSENILNIALINQWENLYRLPLLVTATCEFGRHDDPQKRSGAEFALISERGGAIGLVTTSRPVYSTTNFKLNQAFYEQVFDKIEGKYMTMGEIFRRTKNASSGAVANRNFSLLGDPSMTLAYPSMELVIDEIMEAGSDILTDSLKALKNMVVTGYIQDADKNMLDTYQGKLTATVYDKAEKRQTLGTQDPVMTYTERNSIIFRGDASISNGKFRFEFVVPKNISYKSGEGKISLYSIDENKSMDASGSNNKILVGGTAEDFVPDNTPPQVSLYLEDTTFRFGDLTSDHPRLIADIYDENGISLIKNNINRGILAILDGEEEFILNEFYKADLDNYKNGRLVYQLSDLSEGRHTVTLRVWDTYNNMTEAHTEFVVGEASVMIIKNLINYPNPFSGHTRFSFEHNRSGENLSVTIQIYSSHGELIRVIEKEIKNSGFRIDDMSWDGRNGSGEKVNEGLYIYRVIVRSLFDGIKNDASKKLIFIK